MIVLTLVVLGALVIIFALYAVASIALFFHIGRYSYMGDASKRVFILYLVGGLVAILVSSALIILNHLVT